MNWLLAKELKSEKTLQLISELIYQASPPFYRLFSEEPSRLVRAISQQLKEEGNEVSDCRVFFDETNVLGIYCAYDAKELIARQLASLKCLGEFFPLAPQLLEQLAQYRDRVAPLTSHGSYLARITTNPDFMSRGIGDFMLRKFENENPGPFFLHVHRDNKTAISFYLKRGYCPEKTAQPFTVLLFSKRSKGDQAE